MDAPVQSHTLAFILGVLIFATVIAGFVIGMTGGIDFFKNLVNLGNNTVIVQGVEKIRYDAFGDAVQYYSDKSGQGKWVAFKGRDVILNNKKISYDSIHQSFLTYFINGNRENKQVMIDSQGSYILFDSHLAKGPTGEDNNWFTDSIQAKGGDVIMYLYVDNTFIGWYDLDLSNNLIYHSKDYRTSYVFFNKENENRPIEIINNNNKFKEEGIAWRDSVFKKPITATYFDNKLNEQKSNIKFCPEKINGENIFYNQYIVIDLGLEVYSDVC